MEVMRFWDHKVLLDMESVLSGIRITPLYPPLI
ncbi:MAG: hypothetical protein FJ106_05185 [Deltaproteobacteria bacterium]|nr:hypothetical protein [Deltaproteobacteria bacterium]